jgi:uncharacterized protein YndB with AHSA1/START domain
MTTFQTSRHIPASPETIFAAFSHPEQLAQWWGPSGFTNTFNIFQFKPGGQWSFIMHGPDGTNYPNDSEFVEVVPPQKVVVRHLSQPYFTLAVIITSEANGAMIHWIQEFDNDQVAKSIAHIVEPSNEQNLDRLTALICGI